MTDRYQEMTLEELQEWSKSLDNEKTARKDRYQDLCIRLRCYEIGLKDCLDHGQGHLAFKVAETIYQWVIREKTDEKD